MMVANEPAFRVASAGLSRPHSTPSERIMPSQDKRAAAVQGPALTDYRARLQRSVPIDRDVPSDLSLSVPEGMDGES